MKRKITGIICMIVGAVLILSALLLLLYNQKEDERAGQVAKAILPDLQNAILNRCDSTEPDIHMNPYDEEAAEQSYEMTVTEIDGYGYIGYLSIPVLELELPIMSEWDDTRLKTAPCRQFGSVKSDDLVIAGHNYKRHFGPIRRLQIGNLVQFTDMDGEISYYLVDNVSVISPASTEEVRDSEWDLVLYTCTFGGQSRVMVGCRRITKEILESM